ncbi:hypothetical protein ACLIJR_03240 [Hydrogenophaga sp. XSHU_21]
MRHAPSVGFPVGRSHFWCMGLCLSGILMALVLALAWPRLPGWVALSLGVAQTAWWIWAARTVGRDPEGRLLYQGQGGATYIDGTGWAWADGRSDGALPIAAPEVVVDLGARVLLHLAGPRGVPRWAWVEASSSRGDWLALRRALKSTDMG